jgi:carboxyl-terminal processing protease
MDNTAFIERLNMPCRFIRNLLWVTTPALLSLFMLSCVYDTTDPLHYDELYKKEYGYCREILNNYFIYRDLLPQDLDGFITVESLYLSVNEPFTEYLPKSLAADFLAFSNTTTDYTGIGIEIDSAGAGAVITHVFPNSPAAEKQLMRNDTILAIDSIGLAGVGLSKKNGYKKENNDTLKTLRIKRDTILHETIAFREYSIPIVYTDSIPCADSAIKPVAYIYVAALFDAVGGTASAAGQVANALTNTVWSAYTILDLRDNPGGMFNQSIETASKFVQAQTGIIKAKKWVDTSITADGFVQDTVFKDIDNNDYGNRTVYLLINDSTAGAAEIIVSCMRENDASCRIFGSKTFGLGLMQITAETPDSGIAKVTNAKIYSISGESYNGIGIVPDVTVSGSQYVLEAALDDIDPQIVSQNSTTINRIKEIRKKYRTRSRKPLCIKWLPE